MKNDTTFLCMSSGDNLGDSKMSKKALRFVKFKFLTNRHRQEQFLQNERRRADLQKLASDFLIFAPGLCYHLSKFSDNFTPFLQLLHTITKFLGKN